MNRDIPGVIDHLLDMAETVDQRQDIELKDKIKMTDQILRNVWQAAKINIAHKHLMLRAPDLAQNGSVAFQLGSTPVNPPLEGDTPAPKTA